MNIFCLPEIETFASRLNKQIELFLEVVVVDAFSVCWKGKDIYAFSLFSPIGRQLQKPRQDQADSLTDGSILDDTELLYQHSGDAYT